MTRRPAPSRSPSVRERRPTRKTKRSPGAAPRVRVAQATRALTADIHKLGFTCFRLIATYDPQLSYVVRRLLETRSAMGTFAAR